MPKDFLTNNHYITARLFIIDNLKNLGAVRINKMMYQKGDPFTVTFYVEKKPLYNDVYCTRC